MSYVLNQTTTIFYIIHKTITFTRGPGPSLTTLGTPSPKRPRAMGWRDKNLNSNYYNIFYITAQYTLCPNSNYPNIYNIIFHTFSPILPDTTVFLQYFPPKKNTPLFLSSMVFHYRGTKKGQ